MTVHSGQTLSHYRLVERIGEGGMGVVWKAEDTVLRRTVAIKVLPADVARDDTRRRMFLKEARSASAVSDAHIVQVHEIGREGDLDFIVMEHVEGKPLSRLLRGRPLSPEEVATLGTQVALALSRAHHHGLLHRDLKPSNILVTPDGDVKVVDFGLAILFGQPATGRGSEMTTESVPERRVLIGTPPYMSPEQTREERLDGRSDIFSLGVVLYEMATGQRPFSGATNAELLQEIRKARPKPPHEAAPHLPLELDRIIRKALAPARADRYQTMDDLAVDLKGLRKDLESEAAPTYDDLARPAARRPRLAWTVVGALGVGAGLVGAAVYYLQAVRQAPAGPVSPAGERAIGVIGFENLSDPKDSENLGRVLMGLITTELAESGGLKVISTAKILACLRQVRRREDGAFEASRAAEAAQKAGARVMLVGQVSRAGEHLLLAAELVDVENGNTLGSLRKEAASGPELFALAGAIGAQVRTRLGAVSGPASSQPFDLAKALTSSPEAYRQYAAGEVALNQRRWPEALHFYGEAIRLDPTFAVAYYRIGIVRSWTDSVASATPILQDGLPYIDRLPERWQKVYRAFLDYSQGKFEASHEALTGLVESSPDVPDAYYFLGELALHVSRYEDHRKATIFLEKALAIDPTFEFVFEHLIEGYIQAGDFDGARRLLARYQEENPEDAGAARQEARLLAPEGKLDAAISWAEQAQEPFTLCGACLRAGKWERAYATADGLVRTKPGWLHAYALSLRGLAEIGRGRFRAALADLSKASGQFLQDPEGESYGSWCQINRALLLAATADVDGSMAAGQEALRADPFSARAYFWLGRIQLDAGKTAEARETLSRFQTVAQNLERPGDPFWGHLLEAEIRLAAGDPQGAAAEVEKASAVAPESRDWVIESLTRARVRAALGDRSGAIDAYRRMTRPPYQSRLESQHVIEGIESWYPLARLEEETGDLVGARHHYREFLACWGDTDLPVPVGRGARSRLTALDSR